MKDNNKTFIIMLIAFLLVVLAGVSYAYFSAIINGSESESTITMDAGELSITYSDNSNELNVTASKIYPREEEWITKEFKVTGNNTTELAMFYKINLVIDNNEFGDSLTYILDGVNTSDNGEAILSATGTINGTTTEELGAGYFEEGENQEHNYTLKIYFKDNGEDQNEYQKAKFAAHVEIEGAGTVSNIVPAPKGWYTASNGTLLAGIKANYSTPSEPLTTPGKEVSSDEEAVMAATEDDYGTSYYFRGNVQNNFVAFAGMCWRIVRVTGDGSIKLVLYNYSSDDCTETGDTLAFARYDGETYETDFNDNPGADDNAHVGFMYGTLGSSTYAETHANTNKSTILTNLETWYKNNIAEYADGLADTIWCNDKSISDVSYGTTFYGAFNRAQRSTTPSLICPDDNDGGKLSKFTTEDTANGNGNLDYKIGLLTVDELLYSGMYSSEDNASFLSTNANASWWTMSPSEFYCGSSSITYADGSVSKYTLLASGSCCANVYSSTKYDGLYSLMYVDSNLALRPAISLKSTTTISSGNGTAASPFIVS